MVTENLHLLTLRILMTKGGWTRYRSVITPEILPPTDFRVVYGAIERLHRSVVGDVTHDLLRLDFESSGLRDEIFIVLDRIPREVPDGARAIVERWVAKRWYTLAAEYIEAKRSAPDFDPSILDDFMARAVAVRRLTGSRPMPLNDAPLPGATIDRPGVVGLGVSRNLDRLLDGGVGAGELCVVLAPVSRGKTSVLCAMGAYAATRGRTVYHLTLELARAKVVRRYEESWTGYHRKDLVKRPELAEEARKLVLRARGDVLYEDWSYEDVTPNRVEGAIEQARIDGHPVDFVVIDYLGLMEPNPRYRDAYRHEQHHAYKRLTKDVRRLAVALDLPIITAWQGNRNSYHSLDLEVTDAGESWGPVEDADIIIGLNQGRTERERGEMRFKILKTRESDDIGREVKVRVDVPTNQYRDLES